MVTRRYAWVGAARCVNDFGALLVLDEVEHFRTHGRYAVIIHVTLSFVFRFTTGKFIEETAAVMDDRLR